MKTIISHNGTTLEFDRPYEAKQYIEKQRQQPTISITVNDETKTFGDFGWQTSGFIDQKIYEEQKTYRKARADELYKEEPTAIWQLRFVLEHKFGLWVAKSKANRYNIRKMDRYSWQPFVFAKKEQFGLTGEELKRFYTRYIKTVALV